MKAQPPTPKPAEKSDEPRGLVCEKCGCEHFRVFYTRRAPGGKIVRSRECRHCGRRVITYERVAS
jgi:transcriptional regulator NrdR family protein